MKCEMWWTELVGGCLASFCLEGVSAATTTSRWGGLLDGRYRSVFLSCFFFPQHKWTNPLQKEMDNCRAPIHETGQQGPGQRVNQKLPDTDPSFPYDLPSFLLRSFPLYNPHLSDIKKPSVQKSALGSRSHLSFKIFDQSFQETDIQAGAGFIAWRSRGRGATPPR